MQVPKVRSSSAARRHLKTFRSKGMSQHRKQREQGARILFRFLHANSAEARPAAARCDARAGSRKVHIVAVGVVGSRVFGNDASCCSAAAATDINAGAAFDEMPLQQHHALLSTLFQIPQARPLSSA